MRTATSSWSCSGPSSQTCAGEGFAGPRVAVISPHGNEGCAAAQLTEQPWCDRLAPLVREPGDETGEAEADGDWLTSCIPSDLDAVNLHSRQDHVLLDLPLQGPRGAGRGDHRRRRPGHAGPALAALRGVHARPAAAGDPRATRRCAGSWSSCLLPTPERRMTPTALRGCAAMTGRGRRSRQASTSHPHRHSGRRGARVAGFHVCPPSPAPALAPAPADPRHGPATSPSSRLHVVALGRGNAILASILPAVRVVPHRRGLFSTILGRRRDCRVVPEGGRLLRSPERLSPRSGGLLLPGRPVSRGPGGSAHAGSSVGVPSSGRQPHRRPRLSRSAKQAA